MEFPWSFGEWACIEMNASRTICFERFKLNSQNQELRRDSRLIPLPRKTFAVCSI